MRITTTNTLTTRKNKVNGRLFKCGQEEYKGYMIHKYSFYSHDFYHLYNSGQFVLQIEQDDEYSKEFDVAVHQYIDVVKLIGVVLVPAGNK